MQKDNSTFLNKRRLRLRLLAMIDNPVILETHGGIGKLYAACYSTIGRGAVFEKDPQKADILAVQRPTWSVYRCDVVAGLRAGAAAHLPINFVDLDPYGEPWPVLDAFLAGDRQLPDRWALVVNDGLRQGLALHGGWSVKSLHGIVARFGSAYPYKNYTAVCRMLVEEKAGARGFRVANWVAYYCGHADHMTHFGAVLVRSSGILLAPGANKTFDQVAKEEVKPAKGQKTKEIRDGELVKHADQSKNPPRARQKKVAPDF